MAYEFERDEYRSAVAAMTEMERASGLDGALADHTLTVRGYQMAAAEGLGE